MARSNRYQQALEEVVKQAAKLGEEACRYAVEKKGYYRPGTEYIPTYNIVDAIGSAVYVDGVLREDTKRYAVDSELATTPYHDKGWGGSGNYIYGRQALDRYWQNNKYLNNRRNVVEIVCVAATFYSGILESEKIQVISAAADYLSQKAREQQFEIYKPRLNKVDAGIY